MVDAIFLLAIAAGILVAIKARRERREPEEPQPERIEDWAWPPKYNRSRAESHLGKVRL
jgi:hypothetical protein